MEENGAVVPLAVDPIGDGTNQWQQQESIQTSFFDRTNGGEVGINSTATSPAGSKCAWRPTAAAPKANGGISGLAMSVSKRRTRGSDLDHADGPAGVL